MKGSNFCLAPWVHMSIWQTGDAYPCCIFDWQTPVGNVNKVGFKGVWNSKKMRELRLRMLNDQPSAGCRKCIEYDALGVASYRKKMNRDYSHHMPLVDSTAKDGSVEKLNMAYFDVRFSNLCNMKCRTCGPHFSSRWAEDTTGRQKVVEIEYPQLWGEIDSLLPNIEEIYFTGGESLIMDAHYILLEKLIDAGLKPKLTYNSNASKLQFKKWKILDLWKHFEKIEYSVSLDQVGERAHYTRHGQQWEMICQNLKTIRKEMPWVDILPSPTISVFNILDLKDIVLYLIDESLCSFSHVSLNNLLVTPEEFSIATLNPKLKVIAERRLRELVEELEKRDLEKSKVNEYKTRVDGIVAYMNKSDEYEKWNLKFNQSVKSIDEKRSENFQAVFPELVDLYER